MKKILLILFTSVLVLSGCEKREERVFEEEEVVEETLEVSTSHVFTKDSSILVTATNPVNAIVNINVLIEYYNEEEEIVSEESATISAVHNLNPAYVQFKVIPEDSTSFIISATYEEVDVSYSVANILDVIVEDTGKEIYGSVNNYDDNNIETVDLGIFYYNDGVVVAYNDVVINNVPANGSSSFTAPYPLDIDGNIIYFDYANYAVNNAYSK